MAFKFSALHSYVAGDVPPGEMSLHRGDGWSLQSAVEPIPGTVEWRKCDDAISLILHVGGTIRSIETRFDGQSARIEPPNAGEFWLIPSGIEYETKATGEMASYIDISIDRSLLVEYDADGELMPVAGEFDPMLINKVRNLVGSIQVESDLSEIERRSMIASMIEHLTDRFAVKKMPKTWRNVHFSSENKRRLDELINDSLAESLSLEKLCSVTGDRPHQFLWAFRNAYGSTPAQYIIERRLRRVRGELQRTDKDITTIALEAGFADHSHLTSTFRRRFGLSPAEFRKFYF